MKILIIYAHPSKGSFTYEVLQQFSKGLEETGHQIELSDLYQIDFQTDMTEAEYFSCLLYTSPSPRDATLSRMPSSA